jgi:lysophospholipase L1-like esterase
MGGGVNDRGWRQVLTVGTVVVVVAAGACSSGGGSSSGTGASSNAHGSTGTATSSKPGAQHPGPYDHYVALGDSYSAGEGIGGGYDAGTDTDTDHCHRSSKAYPQLLKDDGYVAGNVEHVACSGAELKYLKEPNKVCRRSNCTEPAQDQASYLQDHSADLVTLTFGGNNLGFQDVLTKCIQGGDQACVGQAGAIVKNVSDLRSQLITALKHIHDLAPNAKIIVVGYPGLFVPGSSYQYDVRLSLLGPAVPLPTTTPLTQVATSFLSQMATDIDGVYAGAVSDSGVATYISSLQAFSGHESNSSDPWINDLQCHGLPDFQLASFEDPIGSFRALRLNVRSIDACPTPESFHPNEHGYRGFAELIKGELRRTGDNPPLYTPEPPPQPGPAPVPAPAPPAPVPVPAPPPLPPPPAPCPSDPPSMSHPTSADGKPLTELTTYTDSSSKQWAYFQADLGGQLGQTQFIVSCDPSVQNPNQGWQQVSVLASDTNNGVVPRKTIGCGTGFGTVDPATLAALGVTCP